MWCRTHFCDFANDFAHNVWSWTRKLNKMRSSCTDHKAWRRSNLILLPLKIFTDANMCTSRTICDVARDFVMLRTTYDMLCWNAILSFGKKTCWKRKSRLISTQRTIFNSGQCRVQNCLRWMVRRHYTAKYSNAGLDASSIVLLKTASAVHFGQAADGLHMLL